MKKIIKNIIGNIYYNSYYRFLNLTGNRILIYHAFGSKLEHDSYGISIDLKRFEEHVKYIKDNYEIIPIIPGEYKNNLDKNTVSISIDDGYEDTMRAVDILVKCNVPFIVYISTGFIGKSQYLIKNQIKDLGEISICQIGAHGVNHLHLEKLSEEEQEFEIKKSRMVLEEIIQNNIDQMSLPYGSYNSFTMDLIQKNNYKLVATSHIGLNRKSSFDPYKLKRIEIISSDTLKILKKKITGYFDYL